MTKGTIFTMSQTVIIASGLPKSLWDKASAWAAYTKNRIPHKTHKKVPAEVLINRNPKKARSNSRPFGQKVICFDYEVKDKLSARSWEARIVGYTLTHGTYQVMNSAGSFKIVKNPIPIQDNNHVESESENEETNSACEVHEPNAEEKKIAQTPTLPMTEPPPTPRKIRRTITEWEEKVGSRFSTRERRSTEKTRILAVGANPDKPTDEQARNLPLAAEWAKARAKERAQLAKSGVYTKVDKLPEGVTPVDTQCVYVVKRNPDGTVEKYKPRKVGRSFSQIEGINYDETYAQMMRPETLKILLIIALHKNWAIMQWDIITAYLQANLRHNIYVCDINENGETEYWELHKALCGLKQVGHEWCKMFVDILGSIAFATCIADEGVYEATSTHLGTHVDDLIGIAPTEKILDNLESEI